MIETIVLGVTIFLSVSVVSLVSYQILYKHLEYKRELNSSIVRTVVQALEMIPPSITQLIPPAVDVNEEIKAELLLMGEDLKEIKSKASMINIGKAFTPRRKS